MSARHSLPPHLPQASGCAPVRRLPRGEPRRPPGRQTPLRDAGHLRRRCRLRRACSQPRSRLPLLGRRGRAQRGALVRSSVARAAGTPRRPRSLRPHARSGHGRRRDRSTGCGRPTRTQSGRPLSDRSGCCAAMTRRHARFSGGCSPQSSTARTTLAGRPTMCRHSLHCSRLRRRSACSTPGASRRDASPRPGDLITARVAAGRARLHARGPRARSQGPGSRGRSSRTR